jgi:predicted Zn-dependent peptidase
MYQDLKLRVLDTKGYKSFSMRRGVCDSFVIFTENESFNLSAKNRSGLVQELESDDNRQQVLSKLVMIFGESKSVRARWRKVEAVRKFRVLRLLV